jgi:hypothetical protein
MTKLFSITVTGVILLATPAFAQRQNTAPPPLRGAQPQNGAKRNERRVRKAISTPGLPGINRILRWQEP